MAFVTHSAAHCGFSHIYDEFAMNSVISLDRIKANDETMTLESLGREVIGELDIGDKIKSEKAMKILLTTGHVDSTELGDDNEEKDPEDIAKNRSEYSQRPYATYTKYSSERKPGRGVAVLLEESISQKKAMTYAKRMMASVVEAQALGLPRTPIIGFGGKKPSMGDIEEAIFGLLVVSSLTSIRHRYSSYLIRKGNGIEADVCGRTGTLEFANIDISLYSCGTLGRS